mgnify:CR=1 FL=1
MRVTPRVSATAIAFAALVSIGGLAWAKGPVTGDIQAYVVTVEDGEERVVEARRTAPGEIMEFRIVFTNHGEESVSGVRVIDPIPESTTYVADSHSSDVRASFEVSIDGGESFEPEPVVRIETQLDGSQRKLVVPPSEYTHVRWLADEALGAEGGQHRFAYRVSVN